MRPRRPAAGPRGAVAREPTVIERVCERVREDIIGGAIPFGARLKMQELSDRYGISHMPIREALRELHGEGLVVIESNRGARVRTVDLAYVDNLFDIRMAIESVLARRAAERIDAARLEALHAAERELERHAARRDTANVLAANRRFHELVHAAAGNPDGAEIANRHWLVIAALWRRCGYGAERLPGVIADHLLLIDAFAAHDAETAATIAAAHVARAKNDLVRKFKALPQA
jgi:DNA-binding GntR family transcriptional regulator